LRRFQRWRDSRSPNARDLGHPFLVEELTAHCPGFVLYQVPKCEGPGAAGTTSSAKSNRRSFGSGRCGEPALRMTNPGWEGVCGRGRPHDSRRDAGGTKDRGRPLCAQAPRAPAMRTPLKFGRGLRATHGKRTVRGTEGLLAAALDAELLFERGLRSGQTRREQTEG
jgi:hypothetical protein